MIIRYAGRNRVEDGLGISVNFFHLDCLASEVRLNVDLDAALTVIANGCYRWLASRLKGFEKADPKQLYRRFVETAGTVTIQADRLIVAFDRRSHNPILREAALDRDPLPDPLARPTEDRVHLPLTTTAVRGLIIFPAAEIGDQAAPEGEQEHDDEGSIGREEVQPEPRPRDPAPGRRPEPPAPERDPAGQGPLRVHGPRQDDAAERVPADAAPQQDPGGDLELPDHRDCPWYGRGPAPDRGPLRPAP